MLSDLNKIFGMMVEKQISYLHIVPGSPLVVRQKNVFVPIDNKVLKPEEINDFIKVLLDDKQKNILETDKEIEFSYSIPGISRFRINIFKQRGTYAVIIYMNPLKVPAIEELGLPPFINDTILKIQRGLVVITGPDGSGKSYTLAALVSHILENRHCQIITLEEPIEFLHKNKKGIICQREIGTDFISYDKAFETLTRLGADIFVFNKVNKYETAKTIIELATGGSVVLMSATAPSVNVFLEEFLSLYPPHFQEQARMLLSVSLETIISQTLCMKSTGDGVVPAFEILIGTPQIRTLIKDNKLIQVQTYMGTGGRDTGMQTQEQALRSLVKKNIITAQEAESKAVRIEEFKKLMALPY